MKGTKGTMRMAASFCILICLAAPAVGDDTYWQAGTDTWFDDLNWTLGIPLSTDNAYINNAGTAGIAAGTAEASRLYLGYSGGESGTVSLAGPGTLSVGDEYIGVYGTGAVTQTDGTNGITNTLSMGRYSTAQATYQLGGNGFLWAVDEYIGEEGTGTFTQTGGTNRVYGRLHLGYAAGGDGTYTISGGALEVPDAQIEIGRVGTGTLNLNGGLVIADEVAWGAFGTFTSAVGGILRVNTLTGFGTAPSFAGSLQIGQSGGAGSGSYSVGAAESLSVGEDLAVGYDAPATFTQTGGTNTVATDLYLGYQPGGNGTYTISDGTLDVRDGLIEVGGLGVGTFNLNGGLVIADEVAKGASGTFTSAAGGTLRVNTLTGFGTTPSFSGSLQIGHAGAGGVGSYSVGAAESLSIGEDLTVGYDATGSFTQTGGTTTVNVVSGRLYVGAEVGSEGTYALSGTGQLSAVYEYIGLDGTGTFTQTGGTNTLTESLYLGSTPGAQGTYELSGTGQLSVAGIEHVGDGATGTFTQTGGTNTVATLHLGRWASGQGSYDLSGTGQLSAALEYVGFLGTGTFSQTGGTNTVTTDLCLGYGATGDGTYTIFSGTLDVRDGLIEVGRLGLGTFNLNGGLVIADEVDATAGTFTSAASGTLRVNTLTGFGTTPSFAGSLEIGHAGGAGAGSYSVGASESLSVGGDLTIGYDAPATFTQTGGTNTVTANLCLGHEATGDGTYTVSDGTLDVRDGLIEVAGLGLGTFNLNGGLVIADEVDTTVGTFTWAAGTLRVNTLTGFGTTPSFAGSLQIGHAGGAASGSYSVGAAESLSVGQALTVGYDATGSFTQTGGTTTVGGTLFLGDQSGGQGTYDLGGTGAVSATTEYVGYYGMGTFTQAGGTNTVTASLIVGYVSSGPGAYSLSGAGQLSANNESIGLEGTGTFTQTGGTNTVLNALKVGSGSSGQGSYDLSGTGQLSAVTEYVGREGTGTFTQAGGTNTVTNGLYLGYDPIALGSYELSEGQLSAASESVGHSGTGTLTQTGGTNTVANDLYLGRYATGQGTYDLSGTGQLSASNEHVGYSGTGTFTQTGGTNTVTADMYLGYDTSGDGTYQMGGGALNVTGQIHVGYGGTGRFQWTGGAVGAGGMTLSSQGTLAMGFDFDVADLSTGALGPPVSGLELATLEVMNGATATQGATAVTAAALHVKPGSFYVLDGGALAADTVINEGEMLLQSLTSRVTGTTMTNQGILRGTGRIGSALTNESGAQARAAAGERLVFTGAGNSNAGKIEAIGGEVEFTGDLTNAASTGQITGRDAAFRFNGGLTNDALVALSFGTSDVSGTISNTATGRIIVSGTSQASFYDAVANAGLVQVSTGSTAVFFGTFSGNGVSGGGQVFLEGDVLPGSSAGQMVFGGDVTLGPAARLEMELGGMVPGSQHDQVSVVGDLTLAGMLDLVLVGPFVPSVGDAFTILQAAAVGGQFDTTAGWSVGPSLSLAVTYEPSEVVVTAAIPGDSNLDRIVDTQDFSTLKGHFAQSPADWKDSDFNYDGIVDTQDFSILKAHFGQSGSAPAPEPASFVLLCAAVPLLPRARRKH